jgi:subtilisin family serine protease
MKTYNVALHEGIDYDAFWNEIEKDGSGSTYVPYRAVTIINERPTSLRQCWYKLSDAEADLLRQDPRVYCVEIPPEYRDDIQIRTCGTQTGLYYKVYGVNPLNTSGINWGLFRLNSRTNNTPDTSGTLNYNYDYDGTGVDFVIQDTGCQIDHPEFTDINGVTRVNQIDWFAASGISGTMPNFNLFYTDNSGHGTHVTGIAAGKTYGRAKNSRIYIMSVDGLAVSPTVGISATYAFDCIKGWHNNKPVNPITGYKRPTVVNMSWGYYQYFPYNKAYSLNYRGTTYQEPVPTFPGDLPTQYGMQATRYGIRVSSVDVDVAELLASGVVLVGSAGNDNTTIDVPGGLDYDNYYMYSNDPDTNSYYYMRGASPSASPGVICVGSVDTSYANGTTTERKARYSDSGPRVDVYAPGTSIVSATSTNNTFGATANYPANNPNNIYKICSISGTSMASPNIAGLVTQILQQNPGLTPAQVRQTVIDYSTTGVLYTTGQTTDYADTYSLHGGPNRYGYLPVSPVTTAFSVSGPMNITGPLSITYL